MHAFINNTFYSLTYKYSMCAYHQLFLFEELRVLARLCCPPPFAWLFTSAESVLDGGTFARVNATVGLEERLFGLGERALTNPPPKLPRKGEKL
jgi:hypothetical protein